MNSNASQFIQYAIDECKKKEIKIDLAPRKYLILTDENYIRVNGFFCYEDKILRVATNKPLSKWFHVFVHEFGHFLQWKENCKAWQESFYGTLDSSTEVFAWVDGKRMTTKKIDECVSRARDLELDCERRAYQLIKEFELPISLDEYAQKANSYVYMYNWLRQSRRWYPTGKAPYENPKIWTKLPKHLNGSYSEIPKYMMELFDEHC